MDVALNETCRLTTGCLKSTPFDKVVCLAGISPPDIHCECTSIIEKTKALNLVTHNLYGYQPANQRLRSSKSFVHSIESLNEPPSNFTVNSWHSRSNHLTGWMCPQKASLQVTRKVGQHGICLTDYAQELEERMPTWEDPKMWLMLSRSSIKWQHTGRGTFNYILLPIIMSKTDNFYSTGVWNFYLFCILLHYFLLVYKS